MRLGAYVVLSGALIAGFWKVVRRGRTHALPRLVAFEAILGLLLANAPYWFASPLGVRQVLSWGLLAGSLLLALHGFSLLRLDGAVTGGIETTTVVVRRGVYRYIRHPLYLSLMLFALGTYLKSPGWLAGGLLGVAVAGLLITAYVEERENVSRFGESYREYMRSTKRFVPFVF
ncbi:MAG: isoprenylcysteine carboxylmethyltransferase family protein [Chloroflexi bacterium]|nr:isoprenylcysteine carboxylmethyltransferase family protein [Chloroflexota bacterium]